MTKRLIDLDDELVERARTALGTATITATVRQALHAAGEGDPGQHYVDVLSSLSDLTPDLRDRAWRTDQR